MKKYLLSLFMGLLSIVTYANVITITGGKTGQIYASNSSSSYVTTAFSFNASDDADTNETFEFKTNQINPSLGQIKVKEVNASGIQFWNVTAIPNISKITLTTNSSTPGTWYMATGTDKEISGLATTSNIAGVTSDKTVTFTVPEGTTANYFHLNLTTAGKGTVLMTNLVIEYTPADVAHKTPVTLAWNPASSTIKFGETFIAPTLSIASDEEGFDAEDAAKTVVYTSDNSALLAVDSEGNMTLTEGVEGTAKITASIPDDNETYTAKKAVYTLTVKDPNKLPYTLVTSVDELFNGAHVLIGCTAKNVVMSSTQNEKNRGDVPYTFPADKSVEPTANMQIVTLEKEGDNWYLKVDGGYLYHESGQNYLKTQTDKAPASISISSNNAVITFADNEGYSIQHNSSSTIFSCYKSTQTPVQLFINPTAQRPAASELAWDTETIELQEGDITELNLTNPHNLEVKYIVANPDIVTYEDGILLAVAPGTTTITARPTTAGYDGDATITVKVNAKPMPGAIYINDVKVLNNSTLTYWAGTTLSINTEASDLLELTVLDAEGNELVDEVTDTFPFEWVISASGELTASLTSILGDEEVVTDFTIISNAGEIMVSNKAVADDAVLKTFTNSPLVVTCTNPNITTADILAYTSNGDDYMMEEGLTLPYALKFEEADTYATIIGTTFSTAEFYISVSEAVTVVDELNAKHLQTKSTTYADKQYTSTLTGVTYKGSLNGEIDKNYFGMRLNTTDASKNNGGIIIAANEYGAVPTKITLRQYSQQTTARTLDIYGSNTPYTNSKTASGEKLGSIKASTGADVSLNLADNSYPYLLLIPSTTGALQSEYIRIEYTAPMPDTDSFTPDYENSIETVPNGKGGFTVTIKHKIDFKVYYSFEPLAGAQSHRRVVDHGNFTAATQNGETHTIELDGPGYLTYYGYHEASDLKGEDRKFLVEDDGTVTSITTVAADNEAEGLDPEAPCYDLLGRRILRAADATTPGFYIQNGRKYLVK